MQVLVIYVICILGSFFALQNPAPNDIGSLRNTELLYPILKRLINRWYFIQLLYLLRVHICAHVSAAYVCTFVWRHFPFEKSDSVRTIVGGKICTHVNVS